MKAKRPEPGAGSVNRYEETAKKKRLKTDRFWRRVTRWLWNTERELYRRDAPTALHNQNVEARCEKSPSES